MVENAHKKLEKWRRENGEREPIPAERWRLITEASVEVGPAIFTSLLIITLSFIPVFSLQGQEGRLFGPLAFTKTYSMAGGAFLAVTLIPVLMGLWLRGRMPRESANPLNRWLTALYQPLLERVLKRPKTVVAAAALILVSTLWPWSRLGGEFLPRINEGDILYMPSTLPGLSAAEAGRLLQTTDKLIRTVPEVDLVFGKAGRAETATDPAPLEMIETTIRLKPEERWRPGMTMEKIIEELDSIVRLPGVANLWVPPIRNRIDMISTGVKSPIAVKVSGDSPARLDQTARAIQDAARTVPGVTSALAESLTGGRYAEVEFRRESLARYGLNQAEAQMIISSAVGGMAIGETVEGIARYPISLRYPQMYRDSLDSLRSLPLVSPMMGQRITLGDLADIRLAAGPSMLKSEQGRPTVWVYIDARGRDMVSVVRDIDRAIRTKVELPPGVSVSFTGQYEMLERAAARLRLMVPATILIIFLLLFLEFRNFSDALVIMLSLPFALVGGVWLMYARGYALSVASGVGFIALAGLAAEFGVIMLIYLRQAAAEKGLWPGGQATGADEARVDEAIHAGASLRVRPKAMTVGTLVLGLLPVFWSDGAGSEIMVRLAAPVFGGMLSAFTLSMFILPAIYKLKLLAAGQRRA